MCCALLLYGAGDVHTSRFCEMRTYRLHVVFEAENDAISAAREEFRSGDWSFRNIISSSFGCSLAPLNSDPDAEWRRANVHIPPQREVFFVMKGTLRNSLNGKIYEAGSGDLFMFDIGDEHDKFDPPSTTAVVMGFQIYRDFIYGYVYNAYNGIKVISDRVLFADMSVPLIINNAWDRIGGDMELHRIHMRQVLSLIEFLSAEMVRMDHGDGSNIIMDSSSGGKLTAQHVVGLVMAHIDERNGRNCNLEDIMRFSGYNAAYINRIFQENLGYSIKEHANAWRINRTRDLLRNGLSSKEIAYDLGFSSAAAFCRWKRRNGI